MKTLKASMWGLLAVSMLCAINPALAEPTDDEPAYGIGKEAQFLFMEDLNIPAGVDFIRLSDGKVMKLSFPQDWANPPPEYNASLGISRSCTLWLRPDVNGVRRTDNDRKVLKDTKIEVIGIDYRIHVHYEAEAWIWFRLKSPTFEQLECVVDVAKDSAQVMSLGEMKRHIRPLLDVVPANPMIVN